MWNKILQNLAGLALKFFCFDLFYRNRNLPRATTQELSKNEF